MGAAEAGYEAEAVTVEHACTKDVQLPQCWQQRQACKEQPARGTKLSRQRHISRQG